MGIALIANYAQSYTDAIDLDSHRFEDIARPAFLNSQDPLRCEISYAYIKRLFDHAN